VATTTVAFRFVFKRDRPVFDEAFHMPTRTLLDRNLVIGAAIFGIGWG
jgi:uncharacterized membrane protein YedE/YeeE